MLESSRTTLNSGRLWLKPTHSHRLNSLPFHYLTTKDQTPLFLTNKVNFSYFSLLDKDKKKEQLENDVLLSLAYQFENMFCFHY